MKRFRSPAPVCDVIIEKGRKILLGKRAIRPFRGFWGLIGGFVEYGEPVEKAAVREAREETGLKVRLIDILGVYSDPGRDPRGHTISTAFIARPAGGRLRPDSEHTELRWVDPARFRARYRFDHGKIIKDYLKWRRKKKGTFWSTRGQGFTL